MNKFQRAVTLFLALLFLATSVAFTVLVIAEMRNNDQPNSEDTTQEIDESCSLGEDEGEVKPEPEVYKPEGDVTKLEIKDLTVGTGAEAKSGDCLLVKYHGTLATTGEKFDGNFDQPSTLRFPVGQGAVIEGWDQGLIGIKEGGVRRLVIPSEMAYAEQEAGSIPANSDLVFTVELIKIQ